MPFTQEQFDNNACPDPVIVECGGTGLKTLPANNVVLGNGGAAPTFVAPGTAGNLLTSNGTTWTSVTPAAGGDPKVLFKCVGWNGGSAVIPAADYGSYARYEITGVQHCWIYYCSTLSFGFDTTLVQRDTHIACGYHMPKSWQSNCNCTMGYVCATVIEAAFGASSDYCTACSGLGWQFRINLVPQSLNCAYYEIETFTTGGALCCAGNRNAGRLQACCNANTSCLRSVCFSTQSGVAAGNTSNSNTIVITGHGRLV